MASRHILGQEIQHLRNPPADILAIQESHCLRGEEPKWTQMLLPNFSTWSTLCGFVIKPGRGITVTSSTDHLGGRVLAIMITWQGNQYTLVNTYAPNILSDRANFFEEVANLPLPENSFLLGT
ncbi:hypothetical protein L0F63_005291 [Massospora cicadina]|nr:hypothetical protein L0F63_005291 [Massospora cicadina]